MTTQFRSRIKTVLGYEILDSATGGCCLPDGTKLSGNNITLSSCNKLNGFFRQGDPDLLQCPERGLTGCCCACSYVREQDSNFDTFIDEVINNPESTDYYGNVSSGENLNEKGLKDNITQCECNSLQGKWFYGKCNEIGNIESLCGSVINEPPNDVRLPAACCHGNTLTNELQCDNVCTLKECSEFTSDDYPYSTYFGDEVGGSGNLCSNSFSGIGEVNCGVDSIARNASTSYNSRAYSPSRTYPCFELKTIDGILTHTCSQKTQTECFFAKGFQYPPDDNIILKCSDVYVHTPTRGSGSLRINPPTISQDELPTSTFYEIFEGGVYAGIFEPGKSLVQRKQGNTLILEKSRNYGNGAKNKKWALIYSFRVYGDHINIMRTRRNPNVRFSMNSSSDPSLEVPTSFFDGFFNTHGNGSDFFGYPSDLFENVRSLVYNGFNDWYIPSIDELSFIYKKHNPKFDGNLDRISTTDFGHTGYWKTILPTILNLELNEMLSSTLWSKNDKLGEESISTTGQLDGTRSYVYAQKMTHDDSEDSGSVYKVDRKKQLIVPLVRRIYID